jgi:glycolate oxidase iron-sulfur subunit
MTDSLVAPVPDQQVYIPELPSYHDLLQCIRCGRCLAVCPTYQETAYEIQSPRGRLALLRAVEDGRLEFTPAVQDHLYHCFDCRNCNAVCPPGVPIGECILAGRAACAEVYGRAWWRRLTFRHVLISGKRLEWGMILARLYQRLGLWRIVRPLLRRLPGPLSVMAIMEGLLPTLPARPLHATIPEVTPAGNRSPRHRVGFFLGCFMSQIFAEVSQTTVNVLARAGCEVVTPRGQMCCGAPHDDQGDKEMARKLARHNIDLFARYDDLEVVVADCAACSGMGKEYKNLLGNDPQYAEKATAFSAKMRDISEWLDEIMPEGIGLAPLPVPEAQRRVEVRVTYHEPCHLANVQGVRVPPRKLLRRVPGLELIEMSDPTACCGSAGIYNITHPAMAMKRLERKLKDIAATGAEVVVTGNPGCLLQLRYGAERMGQPLKVVHLTQILDGAWRQKTVAGG